MKPIRARRAFAGALALLLSFAAAAGAATPPPSADSRVPLRWFEDESEALAWLRAEDAPRPA